MSVQHGSQMEKFQEKKQHLMGPLSRVSKGLEDYTKLII